MKRLLTIFFLLVCYNAVAQTTRPSGFPSRFNTLWERIGYSQADSGTILPRRDTLSFLPRFTGTVVIDPLTRRPYFYDSTDLRWYRFLFTGDIADVLVSNGLSKDGDTVELGGTLDHATDIALNGNSLSFTGTGNVGIGIASPTRKLHIDGDVFVDDSLMVNSVRSVALTDNHPLILLDATTRSLTQISGNSYVKNQYATQQAARAWFDSARLGNLILSRRGGTSPSIFSETSLWYMSRGVHTYSGWDANEYPLIQMTTFNNNQSNRFSGVITGFNFSNTGTTNKPLVIATSGFSNARSGDIILSTGRGLLADTLQDFKMNVNYNIILDPSGSGGEVQMTHVTNLQSGLKLNDSVSSATSLTITIARAVWIFNGSSTTTWTLPTVSGNTDVTFFIKNKGSADIVLTAGTNEIYSTAATTTFNITAGQGYMVHNDGTNWTIMNN